MRNKYSQDIHLAQWYYLYYFIYFFRLDALFLRNFMVVFFLEPTNLFNALLNLFLVVFLKISFDTV